jgi:hypothetical protein
MSHLFLSRNIEDGNAWTGGDDDISGGGYHSAAAHKAGPVQRKVRAGDRSLRGPCLHTRHQHHRCAAVSCRCLLVSSVEGHARLDGVLLGGALLDVSRGRASLDRFTPGRPSSYAGYPRHLMTPPAPTTPLGTAAMPAGWRTTSRATSRWRRGSIACAGCDADAHRATRQPKTRSVVLGDRPTSAHRMVS